MELGRDQKSLITGKPKKRHSMHVVFIIVCYTGYHNPMMDGFECVKFYHTEQF
jgi:hypothetical protein